VRRDDAEKKNYFRSPERVFRMNGAWYFATREGEQGPFASELEALKEIKRFITEKTELAQFQRKREDERLRSSMRVKETDPVRRGEVISSRDLPSKWPVPPLLVERAVSI
jgi:predicted ATPase